MSHDIDISAFSKLIALKDFLQADSPDDYTYVRKLLNAGNYSRLPEGAKAIKLARVWFVLLK